MLLTDIGAIGKSRLGGGGGCALRIHSQSVQATVDGQSTVVLDSGVQGNVAAASGLRGSISIARQRALLQGSDTLTRSLVSTNTLGRTNLYSRNTGLRLASVCLARIAFTRMKPFLTSR